MYIDSISIISTLLILVLAIIGYSRDYVISLHERFLSALIFNSIKLTQLAYPDKKKFNSAWEMVLTSLNKIKDSENMQSLPQIFETIRNDLSLKLFRSRLGMMDQIQYNEINEAIKCLDVWRNATSVSLKRMDKIEDILVCNYMFKDKVKQLL